MKPFIQKNFPMGIKEQLIRQLRAMIEAGELKPGSLLMAAADLGKYLNINRNTVAGVYKDLEAQGLVKVVKGSGTYVETPAADPYSGQVREIFNKAWKSARDTGAPPDRIREIFLTGLLQAGAPAKDKEIILVDCNHEVLETLEQQIRERLPKPFPLAARQVLIQKIQAAPDWFIRASGKADLLACGMNHMTELMAAVPEIAVPVTGFLIRTDFKIMNQILQLPPGTRVGYCCISNKSARAFFSQAAFSSGSRIIRCHAGINDRSDVKAMLDTCDPIFATHYVYEQLARENAQGKKIIRVDLDIDRESLDFIISSLQGG